MYSTLASSHASSTSTLPSPQNGAGPVLLSPPLLLLPPVLLGSGPVLLGSGPVLGSEVSVVDEIEVGPVVVWLPPVVGVTPVVGVPPVVSSLVAVVDPTVVVPDVKPVLVPPLSPHAVTRTNTAALHPYPRIVMPPVDIAPAGLTSLCPRRYLTARQRAWVP